MHASVIIIMIQLYIKKGVKNKKEQTKNYGLSPKIGKEKKIGGMQSSPVTPDS